MCTLVEEYAKEYAKEAVAEAVAEKEAATVERIHKALNIGIEEACELVGITVEKYNEYKKKNTQ